MKEGNEADRAVEVQDGLSRCKYRVPLNRNQTVMSLRRRAELDIRALHDGVMLRRVAKRNARIRQPCFLTIKYESCATGITPDNLQVERSLPFGDALLRRPQYHIQLKVPASVANAVAALSDGSLIIRRESDEGQEA